MSYQFYWYPKCTTCQKAKKQLEASQIEFDPIDLKQNPPSAWQLGQWLTDNPHYQLKQLFNTSGIRYRELGLKDKLPNMCPQEALELLADDGMLIKRPILVDQTGKLIQIGYRKPYDL